MKKKLLSLLLGAALAGSLLSGCGETKQEEKQEETQTESEGVYAYVNEDSEVVYSTEELIIEVEPVEPKDPITILYTNDIHGYIANTQESGEDALRFSTIGQLKKDLEAEGRNVLLVDAGDEIQGCSFSAIDEGESIINLMNAAGYDLATVGNHEFDYGPNTLFQRVDQAEYDYISCNFHTIEESAEGDPFEAVKIFEFGETKVAFIGITTPDTISASTPVYFQDADGNYIYSIDGIGNPEELYAAVQAAIDSVRDEVDYVIALAHTGIDSKEEEKGIASTNIIQNTTGLDAYIDGHSHTTLENTYVADKENKDVVLAQTGSYLSAIGMLEILEDGTFQTTLITSYDGEDETVAAIEDELIARVDAELGVKIGELDTELYVSNPEDANQRLVRARELNSGDFTADAFYWYFNCKKQMDCDIAFINGGGVRSNIPAGDVTLNSAKCVLPFGNMVCLVSATGQQILDALEMGVTVCEVWDDQWNSPSENGGFMHVAGMSYTVDTTIPSSVVTDENGMFVSVDGEYRVRDVQIYNKETDSYEPMELDKTYSVGSINYLLRHSGNGLSMFADCDMIVDYVGLDCDIFADYVKAFAKEGDYAKINSQNSPLKTYTGYALDYENPYGSGRINLLGIE